MKATMPGGELYFDVLRELGNIGSSNAITALSKMLGADKAMIHLPRIRLLGFAEAAAMVGGPEEQVFGMLVTITGDLSGMILYIIRAGEARTLIRYLYASDPDGDEFCAEISRDRILSDRILSERILRDSSKIQSSKIQSSRIRPNKIRPGEISLNRAKFRGDFSDMDISALTEMCNILSTAYLNALGQLTGVKVFPSVPVLTMDMAAAVFSVPAIEFGKVADSALFIETVFGDGATCSRSYFILVPEPSSFHLFLGSFGLS